MTVSPRHENSLERLRKLLEELKAQVWFNDNERGKKGWKLPPIVINGRPIEFTLDCFARLANGVMVCFEVDYQMKDSPKAAAKMLYRDEVLKQFGIMTIRLTPALVDMIKTAGHLQEEIDYHVRCRRGVKMVV